MDADPAFWVRVLLFENITNCKIKAENHLKIRNSKNNRTLKHFQSQSNPVEIKANNAGFRIGDRKLAARNFIVETQKPDILTINQQDYRGKLNFHLNHDSNSFDVINLVPLEPYLGGVIAAEMPDYWEPQALKAQTIAARTYCWYIKHRFGKNRSWDIKRTAANQVYNGVKAESAAVWDAIEQSWGLILVNKKDQNFFPAYYSAICGGHTENSKNVFGGKNIEPLKGVPCPYCKQVATASTFFWPMAKFDKKTVSRKLKEKYPKLNKLGKIKEIIPTRKSDYETFTRITSLKLVGATGKSDYLRAEDLRLTIDPSGNKIRSTIFQIAQTSKKWIFKSGRGYGHGVGLCQCGAEGMARNGFSAQQILDHYYPRSEIKNLY